MKKEKNNNNVKNNDFPINEIDVKAKEFYVTYPERVLAMVEELRKRGTTIKSELGIEDTNAVKTATDFLNSIDEYEKKAKIAFNYCENYVKSNKPVPYNVLVDAYDSRDNLVEMSVKLRAAVEKVKGNLAKFIKSQKQDFISNTSKMRIELVNQIEKEMHKYTGEEKECAIQILKNMTKMEERTISILNDNGNLGELEKEINDMKEKTLETYKSVFDKK